MAVKRVDGENNEVDGDRWSGGSQVSGGPWIRLKLGL